MSGSARIAVGAPCLDPPALPSIQTGLVGAQQPSSELVEGVGAAHAQKRVCPKGVSSLPRPWVRAHGVYAAFALTPRRERRCPAAIAASHVVRRVMMAWI